MGELVNLEEYRKQKEQEETEKIQEELQQLKEKIEGMIQPQPNYIPVFPQDEYFQWHPPHLISYQDYETDFSWGAPESYEFMIDSDFDWEKS